jgi:2-methylisocitrate lyase-like PEP mutase family enzyme
MVEGGKTPVQSATELGRQGFRLVIFPGGTVRAVAHLLTNYYGRLQAEQSTLGMKDEMLDFDELNRLIGTPELLKLGKKFER